jgi:hypothetical protein
MRNETITRLVGSLVGGAMIVVALAAFGAVMSRVHDAESRSLAAPIAVLHASEAITVSAN